MTNASKKTTDMKHRALNKIHNNSYTDRHGITWYWAKGMSRFVTIPDND